jgi:hypothetical protein
MKRKVKRYNGEESSVVQDFLDEAPRAAEDVALDEAMADYQRRSDAKREDTTEEFKRPIKSTADAKSETAEPAASKKTSFSSAFAEARAKALKGGPKTFEWNGKRYGTALKGETKSKSEPPAKPKSVAEAEYKSTPVKTSKERMAEIKEQTPLRNPSGGFDFLKAAERSARVKGEAMKESGRQSRVDRIRRNVGSNLETYGMKKGGKVSSASSRADGCAMRGKTRGKMY